MAKRGERHGRVIGGPGAPTPEPDPPAAPAEEPSRAPGPAPAPSRARPRRPGEQKKYARRREVDWDAVRFAWATTPGLTFDAISRRYRIARKIVESHAHDEDWMADREGFVRDVIAEARHLVAVEHARLVVQQLIDAVRDMGQLREIVMKKLIERASADEEDFERSVQTIERDPNDENRVVKRTVRRRPVAVDTPFVTRIIETHLRVALAALGIAGPGGKLPELTAGDRGADAADADFDIR